MRKWLTVGALALVALWGPYLYAELTHAPVETKDTPPAADLDGVDAVDDLQPELAEAEEEGQGPEEPAEPEEEPELAEPEEVEEEELPAEDLAQAEEPADPADELAKGAEAVPGEEAAQDPDNPGDDAPTVKVAMTTALAPMIGAGVHAVPTLKRAYENETRDSLWASDAEARLLAMLGAAEMPADVIQSTRCQKTVCRIELTWNQEFHESYVDAYDSMRETFGSNIGVVPLEAEADEERMAVYVPREGYTLADLQQ